MSSTADMPIEELQLYTIQLRLFRRAGCRTVGDVVGRRPDGLRRVNGIGPVLMGALYEKLRPLIPGILPVPPSSKPPIRITARAPNTSNQPMRTVELEGIHFLRMCWSGKTVQQIAAQHHCSSSAVYARKRRLVLHYAQRAYLQRLPEGLQDYVLQESQKLLATTLARHSHTGHPTASDRKTERQASDRHDGVLL